MNLATLMVVEVTNTTLTSSSLAAVPFGSLLVVDVVDIGLASACACAWATCRSWKIIQLINISNKIKNERLDVRWVVFVAARVVVAFDRAIRVQTDCHLVPLIMIMNIIDSMIDFFIIPLTQIIVHVVIEFVLLLMSKLTLLLLTNLMDLTCEQQRLMRQVMMRMEATEALSVDPMQNRASQDMDAIAHEPTSSQDLHTKI